MPLKPSLVAGFGVDEWRLQAEVLATLLWRLYHECPELTDGSRWAISTVVEGLLEEEFGEPRWAVRVREADEGRHLPSGPRGIVR
jgi:hypothetical protein